MQALYPMKISWPFQSRFRTASEIHARSTRLLGDARGERAAQSMDGILAYPTHSMEQGKMSEKKFVWQRVIKDINQEIKNGIA